MKVEIVFSKSKSVKYINWILDRTEGEVTKIQLCAKILFTFARDYNHHGIKYENPFLMGKGNCNG